jgi:hypothetical protein
MRLFKDAKKWGRGGGGINRNTKYVTYIFQLSISWNKSIKSLYFLYAFHFLMRFRALQQREVSLSILGISSNTQKNGAKRGTSEYSRALAAILWSRHTRILQISPSATGMVGYAALVLWFPIKFVAILLFGEVLWCPALQMEAAEVTWGWRWQSCILGDMLTYPWASVNSP